MRTERQWQKLWDRVAKSYAANPNPYFIASKLLLLHAGEILDSDDPLKFDKLQSVDSKDWYAWIKRLITGRWNTHHGRKILDMFYTNSAALTKTRVVQSNHPAFPYFLCNLIESAFADTAINPNGDLANLLRVIEKNIGTTIIVDSVGKKIIKTTHIPIAVKYEDHGIDHLRAVVKECRNVFRAYKASETNYYRNKALLIFPAALHHIGQGIFSIASTPFILLRNAFITVFFSRSSDESWTTLGEDISDNAGLTITEPLSALGNGLLLLTRGLAELFIVSPLTYIAHFFRPEKNESIEEKIHKSSGLQCLYRHFNELKKKNTDCPDKTPEQQNEKNELQNSMNKCKKDIISEVHRKYLQGKTRGVKTNIDENKEADCFMKALCSDLFKKNTDSPPEEEIFDKLQKIYWDLFRAKNTNEKNIPEKPNSAVNVDNKETDNTNASSSTTHTTNPHH